MKLQAIVSSAVLAAAISFSGATFAQDADVMLNDVVVPPDQMQVFKDRCIALQSASTASLTNDDTNSNGDSNSDDLTTGSTNQSGSPDPASAEYWTEAMAAVTIDECKAAGFIAG